MHIRSFICWDCALPTSSGSSPERLTKEMHGFGYYLIFGLLLFLSGTCSNLKIDDDEFELNLQLIKHQPCSFKPDKSKWERKLEFEAGTEKEGPKLMPLANETNVRNRISANYN